jgi:hypothetical protein
MLMQMLNAGGLPALADDHRPADEDNPRGYLEYQAARRLHEDQAWLDQARGRSVKVVAQLLPCLPARHAYRVLLIQRDMGEVLASQRVMLERQGARGDARSADLLRREYGRQMRNVRRWLAQQPNVRTLLLSYHEVLANAEGTAQAIRRFLGGGLDVERMTAAVDVSLHRQQGPKRAGG